MRRMPANNMVIRKATAEDVDRMTELDKICFTVPWSKAEFEKEMTSNPLALYMVAESEQEIIGYAGVWLIVDEGHITNVAVHPMFRERGIASRLIESLLSRSKEKAGTKNFTLEVRVSNVAAIELYKGFGFKEIGLRKGYYSDNKEDAAIMWLMEESEQI